MKLFAGISRRMKNLLTLRVTKLRIDSQPWRKTQTVNSKQLHPRYLNSIILFLIFLGRTEGSFRATLQTSCSFKLRFRLAILSRNASGSLSFRATLQARYPFEQRFMFAILSNHASASLQDWKENYSIKILSACHPTSRNKQNIVPLSEDET